LLQINGKILSSQVANSMFLNSFKSREIESVFFLVAKLPNK